MTLRHVFSAGVLVVALTAFVGAQSKSPVADAAMRGDAAAVQSLVAKGADVNVPQADGMTALHWSALNGDLKTMNVLLTAKAKVEPLTRLGSFTPLHLASSRGNAAAAARLLEAGSRPGAVTDTGVQPLHLAAEAGNADVIKALLDRGADLNARDTTHGRTPLIFAASQNRLDAMKVLIAKGADVKIATTVVDYRERSAADTQARQARDRMITEQTGRATNSGVNINDPPPAGTAGVGGARGGAPAGGQAAAAGGARPGGAGAGAGGPRAPSDIEQIGRQGGFTALHYAVRDGYADAATLLLDAGMDINRRTDGDRSSPLVVAAINGQYDIAMTLLARNADPNLASDDGVAPLFAVLNNEWQLRTWYPQPTAGSQQKASYLQLLEALLKAGADPDARTV
jgi:ankyrin repeat protein